MPSLADLLGMSTRPPEPPPPDFDPARPWDSPSLRAIPTPMATPSPAATPYAYSVPDPLAQAAHFTERQQAAANLSSPTTPVLEVPASLLSLLIDLLPKKKEKK